MLNSSASTTNNALGQETDVPLSPSPPRTTDLGTASDAYNTTNSDVSQPGTGLTPSQPQAQLLLGAAFESTLRIAAATFYDPVAILHAVPATIRAVPTTPATSSEWLMAWGALSFGVKEVPAGRCLLLVPFTASTRRAALASSRRRLKATSIQPSPGLPL